MGRILADEGSLRSEPVIERKLGEMVQVLVEADFGLTKDRRRSDKSGWYVSASSVRGRSLSTRRAILYCRLGDVILGCFLMRALENVKLGDASGARA